MASRTAGQEQPDGGGRCDQQRAEQKPGGFDVDVLGGEFHIRSVCHVGSPFITQPDELALPHVGDSAATFRRSLTAERSRATMGSWHSQLR